MPKVSPDEDLLEWYLDTRTQSDPDGQAPFSLLLRDFQNWLTVQGISPRTHTRKWFTGELEKKNYRRIAQRGVWYVPGITLPPTTPALPQARFGWKEVHRYAAQHPLEAANLPVEWQYDDRRRLPPDEYTWQRFVEDCAHATPRGRRIPGTHGRKWASVLFVRWDTFCTAFWQWLAQQRPSTGVRRYYTQDWLYVQAKGHSLELRRIYGTRYVLGMALIPELDVVPPAVAARTGAEKPPMRERFDTYWAKRERAARAAAGMPVDDAFYVKDAACVGRSDTRGQEVSDDARSRQAILLPLARQHFEQTFVSDPSSSVSLAEVKRSFAHALINTSQRETGADQAIRMVVAERGYTVAEGKKRLLVLQGLRFRTPDD